MKRRWLRRLFLRRVLVALMILLQLGFIVYTLSVDTFYARAFSAMLRTASVFVVLYIISRKTKPAYRLIWIILILVFPVLGCLAYLLFNFQASTRYYRQKLAELEKATAPLMACGGNSLPAALAACPEASRDLAYLQNCAHFPVSCHTATSYYSPGEAFLPAFLADLERAERYIFLEYFILEEGVLWGQVLEILRRKAAAGVLVRVMYDDMGCFFTLPGSYARQLREYGIETAVFNPFSPIITSIQNNRDHRKIASIDGRVAYTGGINLADEYINAIEKHGYWKDAALRLEGEAAWSLTVIFLQLWQLTSHTPEPDIEALCPWRSQPCTQPQDGFVLPYADSPMDAENVGEHVYIQIINQARHTLYINTPYLIVDDNLVSALSLAAKSGVDVRIVTPARWDKRLVHITTRSYYRQLIEAGVKVYEYSQGFMHAKTFVADGKVATVGTINLDFRSLYLHFECGVWMHSSSAVRQVEEDFLATLPSCHEVTLEECRCGTLLRLLQEVLRLFAPLM